MVKKYHVLAIASILLIPVVTVLGGLVFSFINPEIAAGHPNYVRNFQLLMLAKRMVMWATLLVNMGLGLLCCFFLVKARKQPYAWMSLAVLGPFGIMIMTTLRDRASLPGDRYQQFVGKLKFYQRIPLEFCFFILAWIVSEQTMVLKRNLQILYESVTTGRTIADIIDIQNASGGMWAFSEMLTVMFFMVLIYLLRPICFNAICRLPEVWAPVKKA